MKNLVKIAAVVVLSLGFGVAAKAQTRAANFVAKAEVVNELKVSSLQALDFGIVMANSSKMIDIGGAVSSNAGGEISAAGKNGQFVINATTGSSVTIELEATGELVGPAGSTPMVLDFNKNIAGGSEMTVGYGETTASAVQLAVNTPTSILIPEGTVEGGEGTYVWVGGVIRAAAGQKAGAYTSTIKLTASYN